MTHIVPSHSNRNLLDNFQAVMLRNRGNLLGGGNLPGVPANRCFAVSKYEPSISAGTEPARRNFKYATHGHEVSREDRRRLLSPKPCLAVALDGIAKRLKK